MDFILFIKQKFFLSLVFNNKDEQINIDLSEKTSLIKRKLIQREESLQNYQKQINDVNQQLLLRQKSLEEEDSSPPHYSSLFTLEFL